MIPTLELEFGLYHAKVHELEKLLAAAGTGIATLNITKKNI